MLVGAFNQKGVLWNLREPSFEALAATRDQSLPMSLKNQSASYESPAAALGTTPGTVRPARKLELDRKTILHFVKCFTLFGRINPKLESKISNRCLLLQQGRPIIFISKSNEISRYLMCMLNSDDDILLLRLFALLWGDYHHWLAVEITIFRSTLPPMV